MQFQTMGLIAGPYDRPNLEKPVTGSVGTNINGHWIDDMPEKIKPTIGEDEFVTSSGYNRSTCERMKKVRDDMAREFNVDYKSKECTFEGECTGPCPACEAEAMYFREVIQRGK